MRTLLDIGPWLRVRRRALGRLAVLVGGVGLGLGGWVLAPRVGDWALASWRAGSLLASVTTFFEVTGAMLLGVGIGCWLCGFFTRERRHLVPGYWALIVGALCVGGAAVGSALESAGAVR